VVADRLRGEARCGLLGDVGVLYRPSARWGRRPARVSCRTHDSGTGEQLGNLAAVSSRSLMSDAPLRRRAAESATHPLAALGDCGGWGR
jgi:hypothetical protein